MNISFICEIIKEKGVITIKIALITDSSCNLPEEDILKYNINILPLQVSTSERTYQDDGIDLKPKEIYEIIAKEIPKTSMPNLGRSINLLERLKEEGYTHALAIHISKGLSGTFEMVNGLKDKAEEIGIKLEVIDSNSISMGLGFLVLKAGDMIEQSENLDNIVKTIIDLKEKTKVYFVVQTLEYLRKGGRIGKIEGSLGDLLNFKPIISINKEGVYYTVDKVRGRKKSLKAIVEIAEKDINGKAVQLSIVHGNVPEEGREICKYFSEKVDNVTLYELTSALGVHVGPGLIGICISEKN